MKKILSLTAIIVVSMLVFQSCKKYPTIRMAQNVDLERFMGDWFVIANIPTLIEKEAFNAVESYSKISEKTINTTFTFNKGGLDGDKKTYNPKGFVTDHPSNAEWKMQFVWPFKSEFIIVYVDPAYQYTIIGRSKRDYVWIMARDAKIPREKLEMLVNIAVEEGYNRNEIRFIEHD